MDTIVDEVTTMIKEMELEVKSVDAMAVCNDTQKRITSIRNRLTRCENGNLIPKKWQDIYEWFAIGIAPCQWREALDRTSPQAYKAKERVKEGVSKF